MNTAVTTRAPFPSQSLAARIERAECNLLRGAMKAVLARSAANGFMEEFAGGLATYSGAGSPLNKVAGLGFCGPVADEDLDRVEARFAAVEAPVQVELSSLADPCVGKQLTARGYKLVAVENILGRAVSINDAEISPALKVIDIVRTDGIDSWMEALIEGFSAPDSNEMPAHEKFPREVLEGVFRDMAGAPDFFRYLAMLNGEVAGAASMRSDGDIAQLCGSATRPAFRRRGVQTALLGARLAEAARDGAQVAVVTTQPGSKSHSNVHRAGFELLYTRAVLLLE